MLQLQGAGGTMMTLEIPCEEWSTFFDRTTRLHADDDAVLEIHAADRTKTLVRFDAPARMRRLMEPVRATRMDLGDRREGFVNVVVRP